MSQYTINTSTKSILECVTCGERKVGNVVSRKWCEYIGREEQNETGREGGREGSEGIQEKVNFMYTYMYIYNVRTVDIVQFHLCWHKL